jgi:mono/diheme cytochrome c family protein
MLRFFFIGFILAGISILALAGLRFEHGGSHSALPPIEIFPDMDHQPKFQPQHPSGFFADGRSARKPVDGTIPLGYTLPGAYLQAGAKNGTIQPSGFANKPDYFNTGRIGDFYGDGFPLDVTENLIKRGQERFNINCAVCHGKAGLGNGIAGHYGVAAIANLHDDRIKQQPDGQIFNTITHGKNTMGAYGPNIALEDRWAIVAYVRALQKSQSLELAQLPEAKRKEIEAKP